jgi:hypothetical protein
MSQQIWRITAILLLFPSLAIAQDRMARPGNAPAVPRSSHHARAAPRSSRHARFRVICDRPISAIDQASIGRRTIVLTRTVTRTATPIGVGTLAQSCRISCLAQPIISTTIICLAYIRPRATIIGSAMGPT